MKDVNKDEYDNTGRLRVISSEKKSRSNDPDFRGHLFVDGLERDVSGWIRRDIKTGEEYIQLANRAPLDRGIRDNSISGRFSK